LLCIAWCLPTFAFAAECTNTWIGPSTGAWEAAENWSAEHAPTFSDVSCIPKGSTAELTTGTNEVSVLQGEGALHILSGSLAVMGTESSSIATLHLSGGARRGPGQLFVTESLIADGGSLEGAGETVLGLEAEGRVEAPEESEGPGLRVAEKHALVVKGSLVVAGSGGKLNVIEGASAEIGGAGSLTVGGPEGQITVKESANFVNSGSMTTNGPKGQMTLIEHASLLNAGSFVLNAPEGGLVATDNAMIETPAACEWKPPKAKFDSKKRRLTTPVP
jgi:hypothetical protein